MKKTNNARWMLVTSMVIFGTLAPFVRRISVTSGELALYRAVMAAILIGVFLLVTKKDPLPFHQKGTGAPAAVRHGHGI